MKPMFFLAAFLPFSAIACEGPPNLPLSIKSYVKYSEQTYEVKALAVVIGNPEFKRWSEKVERFNSCWTTEYDKNYAPYADLSDYWSVVSKLLRNHRYFEAKAVKAPLLSDYKFNCPLQGDINLSGANAALNEVVACSNSYRSKISDELDRRAKELTVYKNEHLEKLKKSFL